eukprot:s2236_g3.t1
MGICLSEPTLSGPEALESQVYSLTAGRARCCGSCTSPTPPPSRTERALAPMAEAPPPPPSPPPEGVRAESHSAVPAVVITPSEPRRDSELSAGTASTPAATSYERLDAENDQRLRSFKQGESLGRGAYGEVFKAMVAGKFMAVKKIPLDFSLGQKQAEREANVLLQEINTLKRLKHPRIVRYHGCIRMNSEEDPALLIFLEYMPSGSIKAVLEKFGAYGIRLVKKYTRQILEGLDFLHSEKIVHRDVKGANILIDAAGNAKLADFGACMQLEAQPLENLKHIARIRWNSRLGNLRPLRRQRRKLPRRQQRDLDMW